MADKGTVCGRIDYRTSETLYWNDVDDDGCSSDTFKVVCEKIGEYFVIPKPLRVSSEPARKSQNCFLFFLFLFEGILGSFPVSLNNHVDFTP